MLKRKNQSGFTLLEVAMVLIVASLIVIAVLSAQGVWDTAKFFRLERQVQELKVAIALYENKMGRLPGDSSPFPHDGEIDNALGQEWYVELNDENLVSSAAKAQRHPYADEVVLAYSDGDTTPGQNPFDLDINVFTYENIPVEWAEALDNAIDDGASNAGRVQATNPGLAAALGTYGAAIGDLVDVWIRLD
ncbi:type II secretion system protein [Desulfonatronum thioautotrophicum]|uniref:type II secretion system protein n=1 Tax=Desulfonatronum thioautotrophicum TaxID=617001 RepID=UPI00137933C7|nr:prepilin-type N-terminal cleavage/methylation domain-containing protein [Desulfonatronum thioautotrophicum]